MAVSLCLRHNNGQCWGRERCVWTKYQRRGELAQAKRSAAYFYLIVIQTDNFSSDRIKMACDYPTLPLQRLPLSVPPPISQTMTPNVTRMSSCEGKTVTLYTGNIMMDGGRAAFLNTSMAKTNAEVFLCVYQSIDRTLILVGQFVEDYSAEGG
jgi:hypothetical protein